MREGPLDMRMNPDAPLSAFEVINEYSENDLGRIFRDYGEEKQWRAVARVIVQARSKEKILTTLQLSDVLMPLLGWKKSRGSNPMNLVFQGLRIFVNRELDVLKEVLPQTIEQLTPGGRAAIITFHSLEDRIVKDAFRFAASDKEDNEGMGCGIFLDKKPLARVLTRKPILPSAEEMDRNSRSRSAKLRVLEKLEC
jgi:16S rRNA (cytosine1402-N4)-methyltransferase